MEYTDPNSTFDDTYIIDDDSGMYLVDLPYGNLSALLANVHAEHESHSHNITAFAISLSICSFIINCTLIGVVMTSSTLRHQTSYLCIINICVVNIILSIFVTPLAVYLELAPEWNLGQVVCTAWIITDVLLPFITILILVFMAIDSLVYIVNSGFYFETENNKKKLVYLLLPWIIGICVVVPLWIFGSRPLPQIDGVCIYGLTDAASLASPLVTYFIPSLLIVVIMIISLVQIFNQSDIDDEFTTSTFTYTSRFEENPGTADMTFPGKVSLGTICLTSFLFIAMWFPHQFVCIMLTYCDECFPPYAVIVGFTWLGASSSFFVPLAFLDHKIRQRLKGILTNAIMRLCSRNNEEETEKNLMP